MVKQIAEALIESGAVEFGRFTLASGRESSYYIDIKSAVTHPVLLRLIADEVARTHDFDIIAGVAVGGVPLAVAVSLASGKPYAIIRSSEKDHGKKGRIIGNVAGKRVLLIEDVTTSGGSAQYGITELRSAGALIDSVITVVDREEGAAEMLAKDKVALLPLARVSEILAARKA
ncbi:MAG: orotate phosphoribosyltransferase [Methanoregulaceae archaeon]